MAPEDSGRLALARGVRSRSLARSFSPENVSYPDLTATDQRPDTLWRSAHGEPSLQCRMRRPITLLAERLNIVERMEAEDPSQSPGWPEPLPEQPFISVVLPVRNEEQFIEVTLRQLMAQAYPHENVEFLVCDGRSDDRTREIVEALAREDDRIRWIDNPAVRSGPGRNCGFRAARGDVTLVVDGHVHLPDAQLFASLVAALRETGADCAGRSQPLRATPGQPWSRAIQLARASALGHGRDSLIYSQHVGFAPAASCGAAYRRHVFDLVGFVDEQFDACEDLDFNRRIDEAGLRCVHHPGMRVEYYARESLAGLFGQMQRYGFGRVRYLSKNWQRATVSQFVPVGLCVATLIALTAPWLPWLGVPCLAALAVYVGVVFVASAAIASREGLVWGLRSALVFPTIHYGLGVGFLRGLGNWVREARSDRLGSAVTGEG